ncbi:GNAT family N-acetyltransferase [Nitrincola alkalilacustris]|uniref:GNAT family N-acetyltransferase n=1 Tax=Nitrincola alkalilacustris TaxID=1571224 RepID=UPI00124E86EF|nr:GNAT family N-acetyltransferase [Nitrincola alkalilacustris]
MSIKEIEASDWKGILHVQAEVYSDVEPEQEAVLRHKWEHSPDSCFVYEKNNTISAYLLAHTWGGEAPPKLHALLPAKLQGQTLFLHDLAVSARLSGSGVGSAMVNHLVQIAAANGYEKIMLVAVQNSAPFWNKMGFSEMLGIQACPSYGIGSRVMQRATIEVDT